MNNIFAPTAGKRRRCNWHLGAMALALALLMGTGPLQAASGKLVDINSASRTQLKTLPGVGDAEADKIIAKRPFLSKAELVTKGVMPTGPYLSLKNRVIAMQKTTLKPASAPAGKPATARP